MMNKLYILITSVVLSACFPDSKGCVQYAYHRECPIIDIKSIYKPGTNASQVNSDHDDCISKTNRVEARYQCMEAKGYKRIIDLSTLYKRRVSPSQKVRDSKGCIPKTEKCLIFRADNAPDECIPRMNTPLEEIRQCRKEKGYKYKDCSPDLSTVEERYQCMESKGYKRIDINSFNNPGRTPAQRVEDYRDCALKVDNLRENLVNIYQCMKRKGYKQIKQK